MKTIADIGYLKGVRVLLRVDFNVPMREGAVADDFRIRMALPCIDFLTGRGARVILMSHIESNDGENLSLAPVAEHLSGLGREVVFIDDLKKARPLIENELSDGQCALLENLRFFPGEKANDMKFAGELASLGDIYIDEAFSAAHRKHASIVGVPRFLPSYAGLQFEKEVTNLSRAFKSPHPFIFVLGGAKFETKLPLLQKFISIADTVFVGGALANDFFKGRGYEVGKSLVSTAPVDLSALAGSPKLLLPVDVLNEKKEARLANGLLASDKAVDAGPQTMELLARAVAQAKFILWNGPLGAYEGGYTAPTLALAKSVAEATARGAESIVGGGDTLAAIAALGIYDKFTFVSTGGGAMLDFLATGTLPGIEALEKPE